MHLNGFDEIDCLKMDSVNAKLDVKIAVLTKRNFLLKSLMCSTFVQLFSIVFLNPLLNPLSLMTFTALQGLHSTSQVIFFDHAAF